MWTDSLIPDLQPFAQLIFDAAGRAGLQPRVTSTRRTRSEQKRLYDRYLSGASPYPALPPGLSAHEYGWAFDMVSFDQEDVGLTWKDWGGVWGPSDAVHFEYPGFVPPVDLPSDWKQQLRDAGERYVDLPWYDSLFLPQAASAVQGSFVDAARGSLGSRTLCSLGFSAFC